MSKNQKIIHIGIILLTIEKMLQHLFTAVFFVVDIPGIGRPDIGPNFQFSDTTMAALNIIVFILFGASFWGRLQSKGWHRPLLVGLAVFDILAEFVFHGFFFITVSVIVSVILLVLIKLDKDTSKNII
jgi:hypothetical protein